MVGARSALFLPYADLGLIIVDEEHDQAYKQDDGAHYHARDMAVVRAHIAKIPVVLASATPSVEIEVNARKGPLSARRAAVALRRPAHAATSRRSTCAATRRRAAASSRRRWPTDSKSPSSSGEQALLFLNRRGYAPLTLCRACGHRFACTDLRRLAGGSSLSPAAGLPPLRLLDAAAEHLPALRRPRKSLVAVGPGVERLQEEAAALFPNARTMVLSSDLITSIETMRSELNEIAEGRVDIIVGTQLVAKGHNFPRLNLVGVVDADLGLGNGDPRAAERTFQLLNQVIGRAGREQGRGVGYLQTHQPEHPVMKALIASDREAFYASEIEARERAGYPPFGRLASLIISAGDRPTAEGFARKARRHRADRRAHPGAGACRSAACRHQGPLPVPLAGEVAAQCRSVGISARMARRRAEDQGQSQARGRRRSAELFVRAVPFKRQGARQPLDHKLLVYPFSTKASIFVA